MPPRLGLPRCLARPSIACRSPVISPSAFARPIHTSSRPSRNRLLSFPWPCPSPLSLPPTSSAFTNTSPIISSIRTYSSQADYQPTDGPPSKKESDYTIPLIFLAAVPLFCAYLGWWQIGRLKWKLELIDDLEMNLIRAPIRLPDVLDMNDLAQYNWRKVLIRGRFLPLSEPNQPSAILIGPRVYEGEGGYHLILPFLRSPSPTASPSDPLPKPILINLGFVTEAAGKAGPNAIHIPAGEVEIEGMMRTEGSGVIAQTKKGKKPTFWTPDNEPEERNWYWMDVAGFAEYYSTEAVGDVLPVLCDSVYDGDNPREALTARGIPVGRPAKIEIRNQHGVYILTWFSIAAATSFLWWKVFKLGRRPKARYGRMGR